VGYRFYQGARELWTLNQRKTRRLPAEFSCVR
jgi:hypothetical protein